MSNVMHYLKWRGDLTFEQSPFNVVDGAVLTQIALLNFDKIILNEAIPLKDATKVFLEEERDKISVGAVAPLDPYGLLKAAAESRRFGDLLFSNHVHLAEKDRDLQFSAYTVNIGKKLHCVVFSGTDDTLIGWKENLNLLYEEHTHGQRTATEYLQEQAKKLNGEIIVIGHSKGGNLALYSSVYSDENTQKRILRTIAYDAPGFIGENVEKIKNSSIYDKLINLTPKESIIGRMFTHPEQTKIVDSMDFGMYQHDVFMWKIHTCDFIYVDKYTADSDSVCQFFTQTTSDMDYDTRKRFVEATYLWLSDTQTTSLLELIAKWKSLFHSYRKLEAPNKKLIGDIMLKFLKNATIRKTLYASWHHKTPNLDIY